MRAPICRKDGLSAIDDTYLRKPELYSISFEQQEELNSVVREGESSVKLDEGDAAGGIGQIWVEQVGEEFGAVD